MGRSNLCVKGDYEGVYYVDNMELFYYFNPGVDEEPVLGKELFYQSKYSSEGWEYDEAESYLSYEAFKETLVDDICQMFPSFGTEKTSMRKEGNVLVSNELFDVVLADNEWSVAVMLLQKSEEECGYNPKGLQEKHYSSYLDGIEAALFKQFEQIGVYSGPRTAEIIKRPEVFDKAN